MTLYLNTKIQLLMMKRGADYGDDKEEQGGYAEEDYFGVLCCYRLHLLS